MRNVAFYLFLTVSLVLTANTAFANEEVFFGEDLGIAEGTRLPSTPNADSARDDFFAYMTKVGPGSKAPLIDTPATEDFEGFAADSLAPLNLSIPNVNTTLNGNGIVRNVPTGTTTFGRYPTSGDQFWDLDSTFPSTNFSVSFAEPVVAFGFYAIDIGDFDGQVTLNLVDGQSKLITIPNTINAPGSGVLYFGVIDTDTPFSSVEFGNTNNNIDFFGFDDITVAKALPQKQDPPVTPTDPTVVPEPSTFMLFGAALVGAGLLKRKKK